MSRRLPARTGFRKTWLTRAAGPARAPPAAPALALAQSPPRTVPSFVPPNVIVSVDDTASMLFTLAGSNTVGNTAATGPGYTEPDASGNWQTDVPRINILKHALKTVFNNPATLPDDRIRLAWQSMWNSGNSPGAGTYKENESVGYIGARSLLVDNTAIDSGNVAALASSPVGAMATNSMRPLKGAHRANFIAFVDKLKPGGAGTTLHRLFAQADTYMRKPLDLRGPWAADPGNKAEPYLGCRRNYHVIMTDGRWNQPESGVVAIVTPPMSANYGVPISNDTGWDGAPALKLPDDSIYAKTNPQTKVYRESDTQQDTQTLAEWAFYSWARPLQASGLTGAVQPFDDYRHAVPETFGPDSAGKSTTLDPFWNPRYDPATWPHMATFVIGIGQDATTWESYSGGTPPCNALVNTPPDNVIQEPAQQVPYDFSSGSFPDFVSGTKSWPPMCGTAGEKAHAVDLWHASVNGRGRFYAVNQPQDMEKALRDIVGKISTDNVATNLRTSAASGTNVSRNAVGLFTAGYDPDKNWAGYVRADKVQTDGTIGPDIWGAEVTTATRLDGLTGVDNRLVLTWSDKSAGGVPFKSNASTVLNLSDQQVDWLQLSPTGAADGLAPQRVDYIRGDHGNEGQGAGKFRPRSSRQGDIVNSAVWYTGAPSSNYAMKGYPAFTLAQKNRQPMIYVGGNDGMLHGFSTADGTEKIAYVPRGVIPALGKLTDPAFDGNHRYFVDGSPMTGDVDTNACAQYGEDGYSATCTPNWRTLLVGTLGAGGKGYFVLDVTNPSSDFTESNAQPLVKLDRTRGSAENEDADMGHITAAPVLDDNNGMRTTQITRMNDNRWAVVLGNGYNSANQRPVLLIQYLDGDRKLASIPVTGAGYAKDNGLSAPRLVDINGDGRADIAYAGDNQGNLWKFDLTSDTPTGWKVAFNGAPLFTATGPAAAGGTVRNLPQPITAPPSVRANDRQVGTTPVGGMMVAFGTGRNVTSADAKDRSVQTLYSVLDNTRYTLDPKTKRPSVHPGNASVPAPKALGTGVDQANLVKRTLLPDASGNGAINATELSWGPQNGWYADLPAMGERLLKAMDFYDNTNILLAYTQVPAHDPNASDATTATQTCDPPTAVSNELQFRTLINIMDGNQPKTPLVDMNGDGLYVSNDSLGSRKEVPPGSHLRVVKDKHRIRDLTPNAAPEDLARPGELSLRPSWRQVK
ncbi:MAG: pilus assembly protein PilC [Burkholderiaceae bacterium]|nr:pilus assembly protein PilC [Burkholderiaceae bacterium]